MDGFWSSHIGKWKNKHDTQGEWALLHYTSLCCILHATNRRYLYASQEFIICNRGIHSKWEKVCLLSRELWEIYFFHNVCPNQLRIRSYFSLSNLPFYPDEPFFIMWKLLALILLHIGSSEFVSGVIQLHVSTCVTISKIRPRIVLPSFCSLFLPLWQPGGSSMPADQGDLFRAPRGDFTICPHSVLVFCSFCYSVCLKSPYQLVLSNLNSFSSPSLLLSPFFWFNL